MDSLQTKVLNSENFMKYHSSKVESGMEHLNTGMMHLYNMIKKEHPPNSEERTFFEGSPGGGGGFGGEGGSGRRSSSGSGPEKGKEDPNSYKSKSVEDSSCLPTSKDLQY